MVEIAGRQLREPGAQPSRRRRSRGPERIRERQTARLGGDCIDNLGSPIADIDTPHPAHGVHRSMTVYVRHVHPIAFDEDLRTVLHELRIVRPPVHGVTAILLPEIVTVVNEIGFHVLIPVDTGRFPGLRMSSGDAPASGARAHPSQSPGTWR